MAQAKPAKLIKSYAVPVDAQVFAGVPSVTALKLLPRANVLLAAAMDRRVVVCDLAAKPDGTKRIPGKHAAWAHDNWVHSLDVHPDGERVATGGADRRIKLWKWGQDKPLAEIAAHDDWVRAVSFSPDGSKLASAGDDGRIKLWDANTARALFTFDDGERDRRTQASHGRYLDNLAWSTDGKRLFGSGNDGRIQVWDVATGMVVRSTDVDNRRNIEDEPLNGGFSYPGGIRRMTFSHDGKLLAAVGLTSLVVLDPAGGKKLEQAGRAFGAAFDPADKRLAWSQEKDLVIWDFAANGITYRTPVDQLGLFGMLFLDGGKQLASGGCNGWIGVWDVAG